MEDKLKILETLHVRVGMSVAALESKTNLRRWVIQYWLKVLEYEREVVKDIDGLYRRQPDETGAG